MRYTISVIIVLFLVGSLSAGWNDGLGTDSSVQAHWQFGDTTSLVTDTAGLNTWTTNSSVADSNATYWEGAHAAYLTGSSYLQITNTQLSASFPLKGGVSGSMSMTFAIYISTLPTSGMDVVLGKFRDEDGSRSFLFSIYYDGSKCVFRASLGYDSANSVQYLLHGSALQTGRWYHVGFTYDDSTKAIRIRAYDNTAGAILGTDATGTLAGALSRCTQYMYIGRYYGTDSHDYTIDEMCVFNDVLTVPEIDAIRSGTYGDAPGKASSPSPAHEATDVSIAQVLSWLAGTGSATRNIYFGTDATPDDDGGSSELVAPGSSALTYDPTLAYSTTYYWRIDEINFEDDVTTGDVWSFTTLDEPDAGSSMNDSAVFGGVVQ